MLKEVRQCNFQIFISIVNRHKRSEWERDQRRVRKRWRKMRTDLRVEIHTHHNCYIHFCMVCENKAFMRSFFWEACENLINSLYGESLSCLSTFMFYWKSFAFAFVECAWRSTIFYLLAIFWIAFSILAGNCYEYTATMVKYQIVKIQTRNSIAATKISKCIEYSRVRKGNTKNG